MWPRTLFFITLAGCATAPATRSAAGTCMAGSFLSSLGKSRLLVGASMDDATADAARWDLRYLYLAGGMFDGPAPCASCARQCTAGGTSCKNGGAGCPWWG